MARPKKRPDHVDLLKQAAEVLDNIGQPQLAQAVRETLPELTRSRERADNPTFRVYTYKDAWEAAQAAGSVAEIIDAGFAALLAGRFKPKQAPRTGGGSKGGFTSRASVDRQQQVAAYVEAHADELGWAPTPNQVASAWIEHKYGPRKRP
ncbi:hypothetical protein [Streptomyces sp. YIM S03343]